MKGKEKSQIFRNFIRKVEEGSCWGLLFVFMYAGGMVELICVFPHHHLFCKQITYVYQKHMLYILFPPLCVYSILKDKLIGYLYVRMLKVVAALCGREKQMRLKCTSFPSSKVTVMYIFLMKFRNKTCCSCIISFKMLLLLSLV